MEHKKAKRIVTVAGIALAAAISLTSKPNYEIPKDKYDVNQAPEISLLRDNSTEYLAFYHDFLDNTADTIALRKKDSMTLDSLVTEAKNILEAPYLKAPLILYNRENVDTLINSKLDSLVYNAVNRPMINQETLVNSILDTISGYTDVVSKYLMKGSIREESWYDPKAHSGKGAKGLIQFTRPSWKTFGEGPFIPNVYDPVKNIQAGIRYYRWMEEEFSEADPDWENSTIAEKQDFLLTGFNGGPYLYLNDKKHKIMWNKNKMPKESINHAIKVDNAMAQFYMEDLCKNIASYSGKVDRYESAMNNVLWLSYNMLP